MATAKNVIQSKPLKLAAIKEAARTCSGTLTHNYLLVHQLIYNRHFPNHEFSKILVNRQGLLLWLLCGANRVGHKPSPPLL